MRIRNIPLLIVASIFLTPLYALSFTGMMAGTGMWGGMQQCPYPGGGRVVDERQEEINRLEKILEDKEYALEELEDDIYDLESSIEDMEDNLGNYIRPSELAMVLGHISGGATCDEYDYGNGGGNGSGGNGDSTKSGAYEDNTVFTGGNSDYDSNRGGYVSDSYGGIPIEGMSPQDWRQACDPTGRGQVNEQFVCARFYIRGARRSSSCVRDLSELAKIYEMLNEKRDLIYEIERDISDLERKIDRESSRRSRRGTEADCSECYERGESRSRKSGVDWAGVTGAVINGLVGAYGVYMDKEKFDAARINNAELGYPTMASAGYGAPYLYAGMYGLANGLNGGGSFGCGSSMYPGATNPMGMPNVFGYPQGMYGPQGGMYGPFGHYPGGMMPGMMSGGMMPGMMSGAMSPYGMMAGGMMPGMMASGSIMSPYGAMAGGMMPGMMSGGMMAGGMMPGAMAGGMMPGAMAGGMMPGAMAGGMMPGAMAGGMMPGMMASGSIMSPYGGGGYMSPYGAMAGGMMPGMMAGGMMPGAMAGGMMPGTMAGGMMAGGGIDAQLQQQMMNLYMQQQQRYQEDMMARQRTLTGLQTELQTLMVRYQQAAYGMGSTGGFNYGGSGTIGITPVGGPSGAPTAPGVAPSVR